MPPVDPRMWPKHRAGSDTQDVLRCCLIEDRARSDRRSVLDPTRGDLCDLPVHSKRTVSHTSRVLLAWQTYRSVSFSIAATLLANTSRLSSSVRLSSADIPMNDSSQTGRPLRTRKPSYRGRGEDRARCCLGHQCTDISGRTLKTT